MTPRAFITEQAEQAYGLAEIVSTIHQIARAASSEADGYSAAMDALERIKHLSCAAHIACEKHADDLERNIRHFADEESHNG